MAMTSAAVLYDRITDSGVFVKRSGVGVSAVIIFISCIGRGVRAQVPFQVVVWTIILGFSLCVIMHHRAMYVLLLSSPIPQNTYIFFAISHEGVKNRRSLYHAAAHAHPDGITACVRGGAACPPPRV